MVHLLPQVEVLERLLLGLQVPRLSMVAVLQQVMLVVVEQAGVVLEEMVPVLQVLLLVRVVLALVVVLAPTQEPPVLEAMATS